MTQKHDKAKAVLVGFFGAGPLFDDVKERRRMRWHDNLGGR